MISNNKNKNSKELTLEQIIHKSKFRKNIDNICLLETKINKDLSKPASLVTTPISALNKPSEITHFDHFQSKRSIQSTHDTHRKTSNSVTARTTLSYKEPVSGLLFPHQANHNNFKTIQRDELPPKEFKKSKQNNFASLEKPHSLKSKPKKTNQFLCVKGASGNVVVNIPKPLTAGQGTSRDLIPEYEMKKYQTVVELGSQIEQKQKSQQLKSNHQTIESKKYHSFMVTKYTTSNNLRQRSVKSKSYSQSKLKNKIMLPDELIKKKIEYRGMKTEQKVNNKVENAQESEQAKSKKMKKYELILNVNFEEQMRKQSKNNKTKNQVHVKTQEHQQKPKQINEQKCQLKQILEKVDDEQSPNMTKVKGFKGKKVKSTVQMKTRYFIPDFIKPSLDLIVFDKKNSDKVKTEEKQTLIKRDDIYGEEQNANKIFQQLADGIMGKQMNCRLQGDTNLKQQQNQQNSFILPQNTLSIEQKDETPESPDLTMEQQEKTAKNQQNHQRKNRKHKLKEKKRPKQFQDGQICAWNQSNKKNTQLYKEPQFDLDF